MAVASMSESTTSIAPASAKLAMNAMNMRRCL